MIISPILCQILCQKLEKWQTVVTIGGQQRPQQKGKIQTHRPLPENLLALMIRILPSPHTHPTQTIPTIPTIHHLLMIAVVVAAIVDLVIVVEGSVIR